MGKNFAISFAFKRLHCPSRNADAPTMSPTHESLLFAKPHEESQLFEEFLDYIIGQETDPDFPQDAEVRYAQTR